MTALWARDRAARARLAPACSCSSPTLYWLAFAVLGFALARRSAWLGALAPVLALAPPAFVFVGIIWRDILLAASWLLAAALVFLVAERRGAWRLAAQVLALALLCFGFLLRPNALFAAPILAAYIIWPQRFDLKRAALLYVPAAIVARAAGAARLLRCCSTPSARTWSTRSSCSTSPASRHFTGENQFPVTWSADENAMLDRAVLPRERLGRLLDAPALPVRDEEAGRREAVRLAGAAARPGCARSRAIRSPMSSTARRSPGISCSAGR